MKTNKKILSAVLASTTALSSVVSFADTADTTDNAEQSTDESGSKSLAEGKTGTTTSPDANTSDYQIVEPESINLPSPEKVVSGNETIYVIAPTADDLKKLEWSPIDNTVGRNSEGYWYGMKVFSPKGLDAVNYNDGKPKYQKIYSSINAGADIATALESATWTDGSGIYDGNGTDSNQKYMEGWNPLTYEYIYTCAKQNKKLVYALRFDWDNDDIYEQTAAVVVDLSGINVENFALKKPADSHTHNYGWGSVKPDDSDGVCKICGAVKPKITGVSGGIADVDTMTDTNLANYKHNLNKYSFGQVTKTDDGNYEVTCNVNVGEMKAATAGGAADNKNVLMVVELDKIDGFTLADNVLKDGSAVTGGDESWVTDAPKFVENADVANKTYVTLWMSMPDDGSKPADRIYAFKAASNDKHPKTLTVKFNDTTTYTFAKDADFTETEFTVTPGTVDANGKATVTITPTTGKSITSAKVKYADSTEVALTPNGKGGYSAEVEVRKFLTAQEIKDGNVDAKLKDANLEVTTAIMSDAIKAVGMTVGIETPSTMTDPDELTRYQDNRKLYVDSLKWDTDSRTATVKVPAELMTEKSGNNGASGIGAANVCLILKLETALAKDGGTYGLTATGIEDIDVEDGWKFVDGATAADEGKYVVLWINAGATALASGTKTVVYTKDSKAIVTVNLVKVPGVKEAPAEQTTAITTITEDAITTQAKTNLGISSNANLGELDFTVGTLPTTTGDHEVAVTVTAKSGSECVLVDKDGNVQPQLTTKVKVTVAADAKAVVTLGTPTNGNFTAKANDKKIENGSEVPVGTEITLTAGANSGYRFSSWNVTDAAGNAVTVTSNKFTMPAGGVTINATFTSQSSGGNTGGGSSSGGSSGSSGSSGGHYGGSSGGHGGSSGGSSSGSTSTYLNVTNKTIPTNANSVNGTVRINANSSDKSGAAVKVDKADTAVSYIRIDAPSSTRTAADWAEPIVKKASSDNLANVKKAAEEAVNAVANNKGFALNVDILNTDKKTTVPKNNVEITANVPGALKGKDLYAYRITERGVVPIFATVNDNKITFAAGYAGEYIFTTEKLKNVTAYKKGNVDLEGITNAKDATLVLKHIVNLDTLKDEKLFMADVNGDGYINAMDATEILKIVAGLV